MHVKSAKHKVKNTHLICPHIRYNMKFTIDEFLNKLPFPADEKWKDGVWDVETHNAGGVSLFFFAPKKTDHQTFHVENEYYFIVNGSGELIIDEERFECSAGDAFFVPAKVRHHFENFTDDFATWAVFF